MKEDLDLRVRFTVRRADPDAIVSLRIGLTDSGRNTLEITTQAVASNTIDTSFTRPADTYLIELALAQGTVIHITNIEIEAH